ncbi:uncharacterized protein LOC126889696 [Diabrotica virgifera virgifera]|uniref:Uncharacterized protein n=1 Tax=Diabrotica virgifera virgifera TaxID=50390 RepID=A0ABM5KVG1_DIAVI|nr:uncharacterized protein LOC126889696 [Diabrotica virgifera virgifera]
MRYNALSKWLSDDRNLQLDSDKIVTAWKTYVEQLFTLSIDDAGPSIVKSEMEKAIKGLKNNNRPEERIQRIDVNMMRPESFVEELQIIIMETAEMRGVREQRDLTSEWKQSLEEVKEIRRENEVMKTKIRVLEYKLKTMEKKERRNNIIVTGFDTARDTKELKEDIENQLQTFLGAKCEIKEITKLNKRMCKLELGTYGDKADIMKNKNKFRHIKGRKLFIDDDYTIQERDIQKQLREYANEQRQKGNVVKFKYQKIIINDEIWKWNMETGTIEKESNRANPKNKSNLTGRTAKDITELYVELEENAKEIELAVNVDKTKALIQARKQRSLHNLTINDANIELVKQLT